MPFDSLPTTSPVIEKLRLGRERIARPDGWCQNAARIDGRVCMADALDFGSPYFSEALRYLRTAITGRGVPEMIQNIKFVPDWQDAPGRQQHEVVEIFDRAIEMAVEDAHSAVA